MHPSLTRALALSRALSISGSLSRSLALKLKAGRGARGYTHKPRTPLALGPWPCRTSQLTWPPSPVLLCVRDNSGIICTHAHRTLNACPRLTAPRPGQPLARRWLLGAPENRERSSCVESPRCVAAPGRATQSGVWWSERESSGRWGEQARGRQIFFFRIPREVAWGRRARCVAS